MCGTVSSWECWCLSNRWQKSSNTRLRLDLPHQLCAPPHISLLSHWSLHSLARFGSTKGTPLCRSSAAANDWLGGSPRKMPMQVKWQNEWQRCLSLSRLWLARTRLPYSFCVFVRSLNPRHSVVRMGCRETWCVLEIDMRSTFDITAATSSSSSSSTCETVALNQGSRSSLLAWCREGQTAAVNNNVTALLVRTVTRGFGSKREGKIAR